MDEVQRSKKILKSMRRGLSPEGIRKRIDSLRNVNSDIALRTSIIVGFPDETKKDFQELYDFVDEIKFDRLGVFTYSEEEGTLAEELDDNIPNKIKDERKSIIMDLQANISAEKNEKMVGKTYKVLVDKCGDTVSVGRTEYDSPEIDNIVHIKSPIPKGEFVDVKIESSNEFELIGTPV